MADLKKKIDLFNLRIQNCLEDKDCCTILEQYLKDYDQIPKHINALKLWITANNTTTFDNDKFFNLIKGVDGFNANPLLTMSECELKLSHVKVECCRILEKMHPNFIDYLKKHHV